MRSYFVNIILLSLFGVNNGQDIPTMKAEMNFVRLHFYTRRNTTVDELKFNSHETNILENISFNRSNSLVIVVHGYQGSVTLPLYQMIKKAYLDKGGWNVIMIDWSPLSNTLQYGSAAKSTHQVAELLAGWLMRAKNEGYVEYERTNLVGFSLGAHIVGLAGKRIVDGKIAKIFALDPALPEFNKDASQRLDKNDADFVQVIHTCGRFISFADSLGHVDFYPNGGLAPQPDCFDLKLGRGVTLDMGIILTTICSHNIALWLFAESVKDEFKFMATRCDSYNDFRIGNCPDEKIPMGYATPVHARGNYYLKTKLDSALNKTFLV